MQRIAAGSGRWFGIQTEREPIWLALRDGAPVGLMQLKAHAEALEIWRLIFRRDLRGQGIGQALVIAADDEARRLALPVLTIKTRGPSHPAETRAFYRSQGFLALEAFTEIWGPENPCLSWPGLPEQDRPIGAQTRTARETLAPLDLQPV